MGIFQKIRDGLKKTRDSLMKGLRRMLGSFTKIDEELFEQLEETSCANVSRSAASPTRMISWG